MQRGVIAQSFFGVLGSPASLLQAARLCVPCETTWIPARSPWAAPQEGRKENRVNKQTAVVVVLLASSPKECGYRANGKHLVANVLRRCYHQSPAVLSTRLAQVSMLHPGDRGFGARSVFPRPTLKFAGLCVAAFGAGWLLPAIYATAVSRPCHCSSLVDLALFLFCLTRTRGVFQSGKVALASAGLLVLGRLSLEHPSVASSARRSVVGKAVARQVTSASPMPALPCSFP
jgi:hypothetical protein